MRNNENKFWILTFVSLFTVVTLCSCDKNENNDEEYIPANVVADNTITATMPHYGDYYGDEIDSVKAIIYYDNDKKAYIASAPYNDAFITTTLRGDVRYEMDTHNDAQKSRRDDISVENTFPSSIKSRRDDTSVIRILYRNIRLYRRFIPTGFVGTDMSSLRDSIKDRYGFLPMFHPYGIQ